MGISETKKQIVIDNHFKNTCDVNTSIKEAFTKGFEVGLTKAVFPKDQYEARLKADMIAMLEELQAEIEEIAEEEKPIDKKWAVDLHHSEKIIQQKIDSLKENKNENK